MLKPFVITSTWETLQKKLDDWVKKEKPAEINFQSATPGAGHKMVCLVIWYTPSPEGQTKNIKAFPEKRDSEKKDRDGESPPQKLSSDDDY